MLSYGLEWAGTIYWAICFHLYSCNINLQKNKFSRQYSKKINWILGLLLYCSKNFFSYFILLTMGGIDMEIDWSGLDENSSFKIPGFSFSCKLDWSPYIASIAKTPSIKFELLIGSLKYFSTKFVLYPYKFTIWPCMEYCCVVCSDVPNYSLGTLQVLLWCYFGRCSSELAELFPLPYSCERSIHYSNRLYNFYFSVAKCCRVFPTQVFFSLYT